MEEFMNLLLPLTAVVCIFGLPVCLGAFVLVKLITSNNKERQRKVRTCASWYHTACALKTVAEQIQVATEWYSLYRDSVWIDYRYCFYIRQDVCVLCGISYYLFLDDSLSWFILRRVFPDGEG